MGFPGRIELSPGNRVKAGREGERVRHVFFCTCYYAFVCKIKRVPSTWIACPRVKDWLRTLSVAD
jgi:hypothetical protein